MEQIAINTQKREEVVDITQEVKRYIHNNGYISGIVVVYSPHTTAGITVNENADPSVKKDLNFFLKQEIPKDYGFSHLEGNSDAHIKGSLMNFSQSFIVEEGELKLGTWQGIYFMEFDGPRSRKIWLKFIKG